MSEMSTCVSQVEPCRESTIEIKPSEVKRCGAAVLLVLLSTFLFGQEAPPPVATAPAQAAQTSVTDELQQMRQAIAEQQKQIQQQQQQINELRGQLMSAQVPEAAKTADPKLVEATMHTAAPAPEAAQDYDKKATDDSESPLHFRIGKMNFTPGGFLDFTTVVRRTNVGSGVGTAFNAIPFDNTIQGNISEARMSAQNSRLSLKVEGTFGKNEVTGYVEADFLGNAPTNQFVTSNSNTERMRLYWLDLHRGKWEFLGGQSWSWLTPNRVGLSPDPKDVFYTLNMDTNYQVGLTWTRAAQFRVVYHPDERWAFGLALENPQQYIGSGEVVYPAFFSAQLGPQFDPATQPATPNLHPDIIPKMAYDTQFAGDRHFHFEVGGLITTMKTVVVPHPAVPPTCDCNLWSYQSATGGSIEFASNVDVVKKLKFVVSGFYGDGGGRYIYGMGPDAVVRAVNITTPKSFDAALDLVTAGSGIVGFEAPLLKNTTFAAYYGGAYFDRNAFLDISATPGLNARVCTPGSAPSLLPCIGFGGGNSSNNDNRAIQEGTFDWIQTLWSDRNYGKLQMIGQFSYVTRSPWFVAAGAPKNAHTWMTYIDLRYILP